MHDGRVEGWQHARGWAISLMAWVVACTSNETPAHSGEAAAQVTSAGGAVGSGGAAQNAAVTSTGSSTTAGFSVGATGATSGTASAANVGGATGTAVGTGSAGMGSVGSSVTSDAVGATSGTTTSDLATTGLATTGLATTGIATTGATPEPACATRPSLRVPAVVDFESYDGGTPAIDWGFEFNVDGSGMDVLYGGFFDASDGSGTPVLNMVGGDTSSWAVRASNPEASAWGGGVGLWLGCMNASGYTGIALAVRGSTPNDNGVSVALTVEGLTAGVSTSISVTDLFTTFELPFSEFTNESGETTNGDTINGLAISAQMLWVQDPATEAWSVTPGAYEIVVDDVTFY